MRMIGSFLGVGVPRHAEAALRPWCAWAAAWALWAPAAMAGEWTFDYEPGEWRIAALERGGEGYLERDKLAVGCSRSEMLFVQRYTAAGSRPASRFSFDGGPEVVVAWSRVDMPNSMWLFGEPARALIQALADAGSVGIREVGAFDRPPVAFVLDGAAVAIKPVLAGCGTASSAGQEVRQPLELSAAE
jgi:hypothetical protein